MMNIWNILITVVSIYIFLFMFSEQKANLFLAVAVVFYIPFLILKYLFRNTIYRNSIFMVPKGYVIDKNTISNEHCVVRYTPDNKIVVMDNIAQNPRQIRTFTITSYDVPNINKCWKDACSFFDSYVGVEVLASFWSIYGYKIKINTVSNNVKTENKSQNTKIDSPQSNYKTSAESKSQGDYTENTHNMAKFEIERNKVSKQELIAGVEDTEHVEMSALLKKNNSAKSEKININIANSSELAQLPGINIIGAKKAIDYRNKNGSFKNIDEFFAIVGVKDFFKERILEQIVVEKPENIGEETKNSGNNARIVDL